VGVLLSLPALATGFIADDFAHQLVFRPGFAYPGGPRGDWDMFRFQGPDRGYWRHLMNLGLWPWWTAPTLRVAFFRPLTSLSHAFDYRVVAGVLGAWSAPFMHAESIALYGGIVCLAAVLYRSVLGPTWVAGLAAILYSTDDAHALPVTWIAMRNALFSAVFGFAAIVSYDTSRKTKSKLQLALATALFVLGLLGGEAGLATCAYLFAYSLFIDEAKVQSRVTSLAPFVVATIAWAVVYKCLGYATVGSGMYVDPGNEPVAFARAVGSRLPLLLLAELVGPPAEVATGIVMAHSVAFGLAALLILSLVGWVVWRVLAPDRTAAFFATGMILSLVPVCGTLPNDRLLLFSGLGAFGLIARFLGRVIESVQNGTARALAVLFFVIHAVVDPLAFPLRIVGVSRLFSAYVDRADKSLPAMGPSETLVIVNAPDMLVVNYAEFSRALRGMPPERVRLLATALLGHEGTLVRVDDRTIELTLRDGFVGDPISQLPRGATVPFSTGDLAEVDGMKSRVEEITPDRRPLRVRFEFDRALEDPSLHWLIWQKGRFEPVILPAPGGRLHVDGIDVLDALLGRAAQPPGLHGELEGT
jgi:hypothetical protein